MHHSAASASCQEAIRCAAPSGRDIDIGGASPRRGRVMLAEDSHVARTFVARLMEMAGFVVDVAENGHSGALAVCTGNYDLVLLDLQMPVMGGIEAAAAIRAAGVTVPIIALTASTDARDPLACVRAGMNGFLGKPFTLAAFEAEWERVRSTGAPHVPTAIAAAPN